MKKVHLLFLLVLALNKLGYTQKSSAKSANDWKNESLKGKVKLYSEKYYDYENGRIQKKTPTSFKVTKFDEKGHIIEVNTNDIWFGKSNTLFKYDEKGHKIEVYKNGMSFDNTKTLFTYDESGNQIEEIEQLENGFLSRKKINKYDDKGNQIEESELFSNLL